MASDSLYICFLCVVTVVTVVLIGNVSSLQCYKCQNVALTAGCNKYFKRNFKFQTNSQCNNLPNTTENCSNDRNCGYLDAAIVGQTFFGRFSAKYQRRACFPSFTGAISGGTCRQVKLDPSEILQSLKLLRFLKARIMFEGKLCTCIKDKCLPDKMDNGPELLQEEMPKEMQIMMLDMEEMLVEAPGMNNTDYDESKTECYPDEPVEENPEMGAMQRNITDAHTCNSAFITHDLKLMVTGLTLGVLQLILG